MLIYCGWNCVFSGYNPCFCSLLLRPMRSLNSNLGPSSANGGHDVSGPRGRARPGTDKCTKSCKHSFSWEDTSLWYIYFFRHLGKHKRQFPSFRQATGMSFHVLVLPPCHLWASFVQFVQIYVTQRHVWEQCTLHNVVYDLHRWPYVTQHFDRVLLAQLCHKVVTLFAEDCTLRPEKRWPCFIAFTNFWHSMCFMAC